MENHTATIARLCKSQKVKSLYASGSVLTDKFNNESNIDLIVDFKPVDVLEYADNYFDLKFALQDAFKRSIDLLEEKTIKNPFPRNSVNKQIKITYFDNGK
ncbi:MAG: nucleotidyltransferase domain-containing protein [Pedobacter sp.]|jgi:hypothetical protein